ncbi:H-NS family nucleoid-associated regulatory protein [Paraburkholderia caballeronis]|uniref:DNA-binding protein H-NS n=1 Tax=Paraburkholderia caballeronis TaxID=416943 RepID=A0A1H7P6J8_9BURK|nr:H-NS histone family protein [Paraburkholderia caballeronis]PXW25371.1 DNA-binding protein H-NS [Paraburkholderia caballeronis]PXX00978.1 DNA-binding protein H-NS [Paraburkholderia caballeronis]RAJ99669.1 DNA-binding protein H-NS [Paraburkholderia caballeronis]TDV03048.1 DNA-binding protein H-NS [Paraburkholderia caballeronis]TDV08370.1 DNA-binding protein H-NS [Paraburkholderia caballeronis]
MASYKELIAQRDELNAQLEEAFKEERLSVLDEIVRKMQAHRITLTEVGGHAPDEKTKAPARYRDPVSGKEWSGRGKPPNWIKDEADRSKFLVAD